MIAIQDLRIIIPRWLLPVQNMKPLKAPKKASNLI